MQYDPFIIQSLLLKAANKTGVELIHKNFIDISEQLYQSFPGASPISEKFLYEGLFLKSMKAIQAKEKYIIIRKEKYINQIARFVGYGSYQDAWLALRRPIPPVLQSCEGNWYYYVRDSTGRNAVLRSPVMIWEDNHKMLIALSGKNRWFEGEIRYKSGGLFAVLFDEDGEKELHLVFKAGIYREAEILKGVFSGFSSEGVPVAGKVYLIRQDVEPFEKLSIHRFDLQKSFKNLSETEKVVLQKLQSFEGNYLRVTSLDGLDMGSLSI